MQDVKELGGKPKKLGGWADKSVFDRTAGKLGPGDGAPADGAEYRRRGFRSLDEKLFRLDPKDLAGFTKALDTGLKTSLPHARTLVSSLARHTGPLDQATRAFVQTASRPAPDRTALVTLAQHAQQSAVAFVAALPPEGKLVGKRVAAAVARMKQAVPGA